MFKPTSIDEIPVISRTHHGKYVEELDRFIESGVPTAEYIVEDGKDPLYVKRAWSLAVQRNNYPVTVSLRKDRIILTRKENKTPKTSQKHYGKYVEELRSFIESGVPVAEHIIEDGKDPLSVNRSLFLAVWRNNYPVKISRRKDRIFLIRKED